MSTTEVNYELRQTITEVLDAEEQPAASSAAERRRMISGMNQQGKLDSTTTPAVELPAGHQLIEIGASPTTIDLTAMPSARDPSVNIDYTGKKAIGFRLAAAADNADPVNVAPGSSNPYPLFGTGIAIDILPGMQIDVLITGVASSYGAVGSGAKNIEISGTEDDLLQIQTLFGT